MQLRGVRIMRNRLTVKRYTGDILFFAVVLFFFFAAGKACALTYLFVLFDAGETNGLIPVINKIDKNTNQVHIVAEGASTTILRRKGIPFFRLKDFVYGSRFAFQVDKEKILFEHHAGYHIPMRYVSIGTLPERVFKQLKPDVLVGGLVCLYERDFYKMAAEAGIPSFGFFDFYDVPGHDSIFSQIIPETDYLFVNSEAIARGIDKMGISNKDQISNKGPISSRGQIIVSGHPNFSRLASLKEEFDRERVLGTAGLNTASRYFIFTPQYSEGNDQLLDRLIQVMKDDYSDVELIIAPHPNQDPVHYVEIGEQSGLTFHILDRKKMSVYEAMLASDIVFTQTSTTGFEAVLLDKDLVHILPADYPADKEFTVRKGLALAATGREELEEAITTFISNSPAAETMRNVVRECYPLPGADDTIIRFIEKIAASPPPR